LDEYSPDFAWLLLQKYRGGKIGEAIKLGWRPDCTTFFDVSLPQTLGKETVFTHLGEW
jgi:hypothetical protein